MKSAGMVMLQLTFPIMGNTFGSTGIRRLVGPRQSSFSFHLDLQPNNICLHNKYTFYLILIRPICPCFSVHGIRYTKTYWSADSSAQKLSAFSVQKLLSQKICQNCVNRIYDKIWEIVCSKQMITVEYLFSQQIWSTGPNFQPKKSQVIPSDVSTFLKYLEKKIV